MNVSDPGVESECESEINRQMLRRNKELEDCIKFQRETLQDQAMRIEVKRGYYLQKYGLQRRLKEFKGFFRE